MSDDKKTTIHISFNPADNDMDKAILDYLKINEKRYPLPKAARLKFLMHEMIVNGNKTTSYVEEPRFNMSNIENKLDSANQKLDEIIINLQEQKNESLDKTSMLKKQSDFLSGLTETE